MAELVSGEIVLPEDVPNHLMAVDAVISATSSPHYILKNKHFDKALNTRRHPLYIYDLAVPRDVHPDVRSVPFVRLRNLDGLAKSFSEETNRASSRIAIASELIEEAVRKYRRTANVPEYTHRYAAQQTCA